MTFCHQAHASRTALQSHSIPHDGAGPSPRPVSAQAWSRALFGARHAPLFHKGCCCASGVDKDLRGEQAWCADAPAVLTPLLVTLVDVSAVYLAAGSSPRLLGSFKADFDLRQGHQGWQYVFLDDEGSRQLPPFAKSADPHFLGLAVDLPGRSRKKPGSDPGSECCKPGRHLDL